MEISAKASFILHGISRCLLAACVLTGCGGAELPDAADASAGKPPATSAAVPAHNTAQAADTPSAVSPAAVSPSANAVAQAPLAVPAQTDPAAALEDTKPNMPVVPFGGLAWDDSFLTVIEKVQKIPGISEVTVHLMERRVPGQQLAGKGLATWMAGLYAQTEAYRTNFMLKHPLIDKPVLTPAKTSLAIEGKSTSIAGLKFRVRVQFSSEKGLVLSDPERAVRQSVEFLGPNPPQYVPLVISSVELFPEEVVSPEAYRQIGESLLEKYGTIRNRVPQFTPDFSDERRGYLVQLSFTDAEGNTLDLYPGGKIMYRNGQVQGKASLEELYKQKLIRHQEQQRQQGIQPGRDQLNNL